MYIQISNAYIQTNKELKLQQPGNTGHAGNK